jgi:DNA-binding protein H-NS
MPEADILDIDLDRMSDAEVMALVVAALDRLQPEQLTQAQNAILEKRRLKEAEVRNALIAEFRERALSVGIPLEALFPGGTRRPRSDAGQALTPKYRGPGGEVWSGRGRQPNWMTALEASGHDKEEFRIKEEKSLL